MSPRKTLRIAYWELTSSVRGKDRRTIALVGVSVVLASLVAPLVVTGATPIDAGLYRVGVAESSPYHAPVMADSTIVTVAPDQTDFEAGRIDVLITHETILFRDTPKGRGAAAAVGDAVERYNYRLMRQEPNQAAAFPVRVRLQYVDRAAVAAGRLDGNGGGERTARREIDDEQTPSGASGEQATNENSNSGDRPSIVGGDLLGIDGADGTPTTIQPPFPFTSLLLAFVFIVPMHFVIQAYATSVHAERINRRGELLLVSPISPGDIIAGKTIPYLAVILVVATGAAFVLGGGLLAISAIVPIALLFLGASFAGALLARSHKELTFMVVTVSVVVTSYVFIPAIFTGVHPIAAISPLTLVVRDLEATGVTIATYLFATVPVYIAAGVLFAFGSGLYREEFLFAELSMATKTIDAMATYLKSPWSPAVLSGLSIPFVFLFELFAVAMLFMLPVGVGLPVLLGSIAAIEEVAKSIHVYAGFHRGRFHRTPRAIGVVGAASGLGFFIGEKFVAIAQLVHLTDLELGRAAFSTTAGIGSITPGLLPVLLLAPLALHVGTAVLTAAGASRGRTGWIASLGLAILVHVGYNLGVVEFLG